MYVASLVCGLSAVALYLLCFQFKSAKKIIACRLFSSLLYVLQFLLLSAFVGAAMDAAAILISALAYNKDKPFIQKYKIPILIITNLTVAAVGLLLYENIFSLLPIAGVLLEGISSWMKNEKLIRIVSLFAIPCWFTYNIITKAYGAAIGSVLALVSIVSALIRYSHYKKQDEKQNIEEVI